MLNKNEYYNKFALVSVNQMVMSHTSKCNNCNEKLQEFSVFVGEGQRLSTLFSSCCSECLPTVVKNAIAEGMKDYEEQVKREEERLYKESLRIVREAKLKHLNNQ